MSAIDCMFLLFMIMVILLLLFAIVCKVLSVGQAVSGQIPESDELKVIDAEYVAA